MAEGEREKAAEPKFGQEEMTFIRQVSLRCMGGNRSLGTNNEHS